MYNIRYTQARVAIEVEVAFCIAVQRIRHSYWSGQMAIGEADSLHTQTSWSALALFAQRTRIPSSARSIGFCAIWVCISSSSSCLMAEGHLESKWLKLHYAKGHSAQSDLFWRLHFSVAICHSGVSLYFVEYILKPPDAWRLKDTSRENDYHCITQKDTQPSQTCSEGYIFLLLFATVVFLCIFGEY